MYRFFHITTYGFVRTYIPVSYTHLDVYKRQLRNLTEGTVEELIIIDRLPYPDKSCTYELRAIFASEDANALFDM